MISVRVTSSYLFGCAAFGIIMPPAGVKKNPS